MSKKLLKRTYRRVTMSGKDDERSGKTEGYSVSRGVSIPYSKDGSVSSEEGETGTTSISRGGSWGVTGDRESTYTGDREESPSEGRRRILLREVHRLTGEGERAAVVEGLTSKDGTVTFFIRIPLEKLSRKVRMTLRELFPET